MSCPYFKESYFAICVVPDAIHVPSIDEMERFCFRSRYTDCPHIARLKDSENSNESFTAGGCNKLRAEPFPRSLFIAERGRDSG